MNHPHLDVAILGGGVAGLWSLARLRQAGYRAILFEPHALGGGQSIAAQGIIHGGAKYALAGKLTGSAQSIANMPATWQACLQGHGELDLSAAKVVAQHQHLWTSASLASNLTGFFASKIMRSRMHALAQAEYPEPFNQAAFKGAVYRLQEPVLDTASLIKALADLSPGFCYQASPTRFEWHEPYWHMQLPGGQAIRARYLLLTAGQGNAGLLGQLGQQQPQMQRRPLHMVMLKGKLPALYAHCLGAGALPRLTITSDALASGKTAWYLGGKIAEQGVQRTAAQQITAAKSELANALPWLDASQTEWACWPIDRAEAQMSDGQRPDDSFVHQQNQIITAWPTKLALAPRLAAQVLAQLPAPHGEYADITLALPKPSLAQQPWRGDILWN